MDGERRKNINKTEFIQDIRYKKKKKAVVFCCYSDGIASASVERGFYYSFTDDAAISAVNWAPMDQAPKKEGDYIKWYYEPGGDLYVTKKITDNLYFYEASN